MKLKIYNIFIYSLLISIILSCSNNVNKTYKEKTITYIDNNNLKSNFEITDIFSAIEIIPLETSTNAIIGRLGRVFVHNNQFYIKDNQQSSITIFDNNGKLLFSTKALIGIGPNEYMMCGAYTINRFNNNIMILDYLKSDIKEFSTSGELIRRIRIPKDLRFVTDFILTNNQQIVFYSNVGFQNNEYSLKLFDIEKEKIIKEIVKLPSNSINTTTTINNLYLHNDTICFNYSFPSSTDTYYIDNNNDIHIKYKYDFGKIDFNNDIRKANLDNKFMKNYYEKYAIIFEKYENDKYIFLAFFHKESSYLTFYDKVNNLTRIRKNNKKPFLTSPNYVDNEYIYFIVMPEHLTHILDDELLTYEQREYVQKVSDDDNYVVVKYKLKEIELSKKMF